MRVAAIGRTRALLESMAALESQGHDIVGVLTTREAPEYSVTAGDFMEWAKSRGISSTFSGSLEDLRGFVDALSADLAISVNYTRIIPQEVIDCFPFGILNAHGGDLPRYRGNACQAWAIINGEDRIALCVHRMVGSEVDAGDILARSYLGIDDDTYVGDCLDWIESETPRLFIDAVSALEQDSDFVLERQSPDPDDALRCFPRRPEDGRIDWRLPVHDVQRLVRASSRPYAGAYGRLEGRTVRVWRAEVVEHPYPYVAVPGQVIFIRPGSIDVACGEALGQGTRVALRISEFAADGDTGPASDLFRSIRQRFDLG